MYSVEEGSSTVRLTVVPVNDLCSLASFSLEVDEDSALELPAGTFLASAFDEEGDLLEVFIMSPPTHGALELSPSSLGTYRPAQDF
ncbi:MAG: hypothetical protein HYV07_17970, partial [Deltaproteobacteria bacterium]|nr:hypothetical protein [Deltaproteobacteria bacterium]